MLFRVKKGKRRSLFLAGNVEVWLLKVAAEAVVGVVADAVLGQSNSLSARSTSVIRHTSICPSMLIYTGASKTTHHVLVASL